MFSSSRSWQLLKALSTSIRLITARQLARWWAVPVSSAQRTLSAFADAEFLNEVSVRCRRLPAIQEPMLRWYLGDPEPDYGRLSYIAKQRFRDFPPRLSRVYLPTRKTLSQFAIRGNANIKVAQATHEVGLTEAYLYAHMRWPRLTESCWRGENLFASTRGHGEKVEDAHFVHPKTQVVMLAIEYAGTYPKHRFQALHEALNATPYWIM